MSFVKFTAGCPVFSDSDPTGHENQTRQNIRGAKQQRREGQVRATSNALFTLPNMDWGTDSDSNSYYTKTVPIAQNQTQIQSISGSPIITVPILVMDINTRIGIRVRVRQCK